jgi:DNA-directed RNA polymerase specialized sigma24 family protein
VQDLDYPEASEKLGITVAQLKNRISDARKAIREDRQVNGRAIGVSHD